MCLFLASAIVLSGCETISYYGQAVRGQLQILSQRQSIDALLREGELSTRQQQRLELVQAIRLFAEREVFLPVGDSYSTWVELNRAENDNYVVWNVFAAPEFSVQATQWCYLMIGCASYRGYFSREDAEAYAEQLGRHGADVYLGGVSAYSTLGWFSDPVLSSFTRYSEPALAALLFHELAHKVLYIRNDTEFNESFASAVEALAIRRWLNSRGEQEHLQAYQSAKRKRAEVTRLAEQLRTDLKALYESALAPSMLNDDTLTRRKQDAFIAFQQQLSELYKDPARASWIAALNNNAALVPLRSYGRWVPAFEQLFVECEQSFQRFYQCVEALSKLPVQERERKLLKLAARAGENVAE